MQKLQKQSLFESSLKHQVLGTLRIAIPLILVVFSLLVALFVIEKKSRETQLINELIKQERAYLDVTAVAVEKSIINMTKDLLTLKDFTAFSIIKDDLQTLEQQYLSMANHYRIYDQIRYIDEAGDEKVRINYAHGKAVVVPPSQLQNKKDRYYFQNSCHLQPDEIYISPLDLNIENGEIELPYKPMIRLATPIYDAQGASRGIVILNYLAANVLEIIETVYRGYEANLSLVNQEGYFFIHDEDRAKEFGFMFDEGDTLTLANINAEIYAQTKISVSGWYATPRGLFSFTRLYPFAYASSTCKEDNDTRSPLTERSWLLITHIQQTTIDAQLASLNVLSPLLLFVISTIVLLLLLALSYLLYYKKHERRVVEYLAHYDQLTGFYSRGWGLTIVQQKLNSAKKKRSQLSFLYLDLDKFKAVNDTYGHKAGDTVLLESAQRITSHLRLEDSSIRLGGDEFLVVLSSSGGEDDTYKVAQRLFEALQQPILFGDTTIAISSSIGIAIYPMDGTRLGELVSASDKAMYQAKINKDVSFVRYKKGM